MFGGQPVVLDCEGLARAIARDAYIRGVIEEARDADSDVAVSAATLVEAVHPKINRAAMHWTLSTLSTVPVSKEIAACACDLLAAAGLHGHVHALDAIVCATALSLPGHPTIYTSDPSDIETLVGDRATVVPLR
jgi:hypothetical protein